MTRWKEYRTPEERQTRRLMIWGVGLVLVALGLYVIGRVLWF